MKTKKLGSQGPEISVVGFGTWGAGGDAWGPGVPDDQIIEAIRTGVDAGMNWIDTAEVYGGGHSEELVGRALEDRDDVMVFTKVASQGAGSGYHPEGVRKGAEGSLRRLKRDVIDLYQIHWPSTSADMEETWAEMAQLVDDGLVRCIGVSNFDRDLIERLEKIRHVDSLQPHFSMLFQKGRDLYPFCAENGTGVIAYGPLAYGLLTGAFDEDTTFGDDDWRGGGHGISYYKQLFAPGVFQENVRKVDRLKPIAERIGISLPQLALAWVFHQEGVTGAIAGSRTPDHVKDNVAAGSVELSDADLKEIDAILSP